MLWSSEELVSLSVNWRHTCLTLRACEFFGTSFDFPPHPEERSEAERLEGWEREEWSCRDQEVQQ
jgi:hypothetical protein